MPLFLVFAGLYLIVVAVRGNIKEFGQRFGDDLASFISWVGLIVSMMLLGEWRPAKPVSDAMIALLIVSFIVKRGPDSIAGFKAAINAAKS